MELCCHTVTGCEDTALDEIHEITDTAEHVQTLPGRVIIDADKDDVYRLNYQAGTLTRVTMLFNRFTVEEPSDCYDSIEPDLDGIISADQTFAVTVTREGDHDFSSPDAAREAGQKVVDTFEDMTGEQLSVDLDNPDRTFTLEIIDDTALFGIDTTGESLNNRRYLSIEGSTPPVLANVLVRESGWEPGDAFIDPFCDVGIVPIEAARIASRTPNSARQFAFLDMPFFDNKDYAKIAQEANEQVDDSRNPIFGSDADIADAEENLSDSGLKVLLREQEPLEAKLDGRTVVFHSPYVPEKAKRKKIAEYMAMFEEKLLDSGFDQAACFTQEPDFFKDADTVKSVELDDTTGSFVFWT